MGKWFGKIGIAETKETSPGVYSESIIEKTYYGDILSNHWRNQNSDNVNDDINLNYQISIIADPFAYNNFSNMRYLEFMGVKWKITDVDPQYPRLTLTIGGIYNE